MAFAAGGGWNIFGLLRSNAVLIPLVEAGWPLLGGDRFKGSESSGRFRLAAIYLAAFAAVVAPVAAVNTAASHPREVPGTIWQLGPNFCIGNGPEATGTYPAPARVRANPAYEVADYARDAMRQTGAGAHSHPARSPGSG